MAKANKLGRRALAEFLGTLMFVFLGAGASVAAYYAAPSAPTILTLALANGFALGIAVTATFKISGGHLNPVVTVSALLTGLMKWTEAAAYITAQILGAIVAGLLLVAILPSAAGVAVHYGTPMLGPGISVLQGIAIEAVLTFFLVFVIFCTIISKKGPKIGGLGIGVLVAADVLFGGAFTGAAMNPARAIGPALASLSLSNWYVYWIGPFIGGLLAAFTYTYLIKQKRK